MRQTVPHSIRTQDLLNASQLHYPLPQWYTVYNQASNSSWAKGGLPSIRHNEIHDLTANLLNELAMKYRLKLISSLLLVNYFLWLPPTLMMVLIWTSLYMVSGEAIVRELPWCQGSYFNPYTLSNCSTTPRGIYRCHKNVKKHNWSKNTWSRTCYIHFLGIFCNRRNGWWSLCFLQTFSFFVMWQAVWSIYCCVGVASLLPILFFIMLSDQVC